MKIKLNKADLEKVNKLLEAKETNMAIADMLMDFFQYDLSKEKVNSKEDYISLFMNALELDDSNEENKEIVNKYIKKHLKKLDDSIFFENPYFKKVRPQLTKIGDYELTLDHFYKNQGFSYDDFDIDENDYFAEINKVGYFDHKVSFLALSYKKEIWMNISPNEIATMQSSIDKARGDVLVYGLGLGYYPFMVSLKQNVKSITIIEKDRNIIDIFKKNIFQFFPHKEKIQIICDDAFIFAKESGKRFDYAFVDLWHNPVDGLPMYLKFKQLENPSCEYSYWLEKSIKAMYRRCFLTVIEEQLNGSTDENYKIAENDIDQIINEIYFQTKELEITSYNQIFNLIK